jgi:flagellar protein FlaG
MAILTCPNCAVRVQPEDLICFRCGANLPRSASAEEDLPTPTVSQKYLSADYQQACPHCGARVPDPSDLWCLECRAPLPGTGQRRISPVVLRIAFPTGNVEIPAGTSLLLGRDPAQSLVAAAFAHFDNVSRRHATVTVDAQSEMIVPARASCTGAPQQPNVKLANTPDYREAYANSVQMRVNVWDFFLVFGTIQQQSEAQVEIRNFQGIYLSPQQAKALLGLLQQNVAGYETAFGEIKLDPRMSPAGQVH